MWERLSSLCDVYSERTHTNFYQARESILVAVTFYLQSLTTETCAHFVFGVMFLVYHITSSRQTDLGIEGITAS